MQSKTQAGTEN